ARYALLNGRDRDGLRFLRGEKVPQRFSGQLDRQRLAHGARVRYDARQRALQLADVGLGHLRDVDEDVVGDLQPFVGRLLPNNCGARLEIRRLDVRGQAPLESRAQALLQMRNVARRPVAGDDDLLVDLEERVESMEKFFLRALLAGNELRSEE